MPSKIWLAPRSGRETPELGKEDIREIIVGSYRVIYRIKAEQVQILTVHHGSRILDVSRLHPGG
jgi:toxin ParE1/3/4